MWFLLISLVVIVVGSFVGEWSAINRLIADATQNFWFGHQGYEFLDLGRFWQIYLFIGLLLWVTGPCIARNVAGLEEARDPLAPLFS